MKDVVVAESPAMFGKQDWGKKVRKGVCKSANWAEGVAAPERDWAYPDTPNASAWYTDTNGFRVVRNK
jgi:hypothetical protein